jgi:hypothetical protein
LRVGILSSKAVDALDYGAEVFYRRLMSVADDYGRYTADPELLRAHCYPRRTDTVTLEMIGRWLSECEQARVLWTYHVGNEVYLVLEKFRQRVRTASKWPEPPADDGELPESATSCQQPAAGGGKLPRVAADGGLPQVAAVCGSRASHTNTHTHSAPGENIAPERAGLPETSESIAVVNQRDLFDPFWGLFVAAGVGLNDRDKEKALRLWLNYERPEQEEITRWVVSEMKATWTDAKHTPRPHSALESQGWKRRTKRRTILAPGPVVARPTEIQPVEISDNEAQRARQVLEQHRKKHGSLSAPAGGRK